MTKFSLSHLGDDDLVGRFESMVVEGRSFTAWQLAHIAEIEARRLYAPKGHPSMFSYCVRGLRMCEDAARKRIHAARTARKYPVIFEMVADGRLHLSAVVTLASYLTPENADGLLAEAIHKTRMELLVILARRFPQPDLPGRVEPIATPPGLLPLGPDAGSDPGTVMDQQKRRAPGRVDGPAPRVMPLSEARFGVQFTFGQTAHDKLRYVQALLGHAVPSGDLAEVFERSLDSHIVQLEKQKFAATTRPRPQRSSANPRHIPPRVKFAVWERDGGQCTFVSDTGQRCPAVSRLEYDHVDPVAFGGEATVEGIRLRCRAHNQYEAECTFGVGFMEAKREAARLAREEARARAAIARAEAEEKRAATAERARAERAAVLEARAAASERVRAERAAAQEARSRAAEEQAAAKEEKARQFAAEQDPERSVIPWLMRLGARADEARRAAAASDAAIPDASLEERLRFALSTMAPAHRHVPASVGTGG